MQRMTCDCGNTLYFGDEDEFQVCDRCGQKVSASGGPLEEPRRPAGTEPLRGVPRPAVAVQPGGEPAGPGATAGVEGATEPPRPAEMPLFVPRVRLGLLRRTFRLVFRLPVLIVALVAAAGWDYHLYPRRRLPCGHLAKELYAFGFLRIPHHCLAMKALRYLDTARRAIVKELEDDSDLAPNLQVIKALPGVGNPAADIRYRFTVEKDLSLAADPSDRGSGFPSFYLELDGTVHAEGAGSDMNAGLGSPVTGRFDERGWFVPVEAPGTAEDAEPAEEDVPAK